MRQIFTEPHYEAIAYVLNHIQLDGDARRDRELTDLVVTELSEMFRWDNPNFKVEVFRTACGL